MRYLPLLLLLFFAGCGKDCKCYVVTAPRVTCPPDTIVHPPPLPSPSPKPPRWG